MSEIINYKNPRENTEDLDRQHVFELVIDGQKIGAAEINYYSKPLPFYQLTDLYVGHEHKGKGHASKLMGMVEEFLKKRRKPGVLNEAIMPGDPAEGMYAKRGWMPAPSVPDLYVYNWPKDVDLNVLENYQFRQTDMMERDSFKKDLEE